jgi:hypothetical protein
MVILFSILAGLFSGISAGLGIWPLFKQPKNIKIQMLFFVLAGIFLIFILHYIKFFKHNFI